LRLPITSARALLDVLNSFVSDVMIDTQSRSMHTPSEPLPDRKAFPSSVWWALPALFLVAMGIAAFWLYI
jgi:hypothetical protein